MSAITVHDDLTGWHGLVRDPVVAAAQAEKLLAKWGADPARWPSIDGILHDPAPDRRAAA